MYLGKRIAYTDMHTHVIIREIGHTLAARIMKYNITTTFTFLGLRTVTIPSFLQQKLRT
jgi:hypothetical protein